MVNLNLQPPFEFADETKYPTAELAQIVKVGDLETRADLTPRRQRAVEVMVKNAVFEYWAREHEV
jgi:hypothetical protein